MRFLFHSGAKILSWQLFSIFLFFSKMSFSYFLENEILMENSKLKKVAKTKFVSPKKMKFASKLHVFDENENIN